jgi:hypothetical protein
VADGREIIHQIEYRWHERRDLSPVASTMSQESLRGWDAWIRGWVRHPHADRLWESVCYQIQPNGRAAIAWRYEDLHAAEREDGRKGRPLVSRVLAGQANLLTPEVAITLCRTGLPRSAGPQPGHVSAGAELAVLAAGELSALVSEQAPEFDEEAARQEGLRQVVIAALARPATPLAIHVRDTYIFRPPGEGVQCPLLWGLRRIVWPLFGTAGRGWSFSTFEPPLGDVDPTTLPDILFRQAQDIPPAAPARPRDEVKVRPFDKALDDGNPDAELAGWLVAEYQERGGDELRQLINEWCGAEQTAQQRLSRVKDQLRPRQSPYLVSGSASRFVRLPLPLTPESSTPESSAPESLTPGSAPAPRPEAAEPDEPFLFATEDLAPSGTGESAPAGPEEHASAEPEEHALAEPEEHAQAELDELPLTESEEPPLIQPAEPAHDEYEERALAEPEKPEKGDWFHRQHQEPPVAPAQSPGDSGSLPVGNYPTEYRNDPGETPAREYPTASRYDPARENLYPPPPQQQEALSGYAAWTRAPQEENPLVAPRKGRPDPLPERSHENQPQAAREHEVNAPVQPATVSELLRRLPMAVDVNEFIFILREINNPGIRPDENDRRRARREVSKPEWYGKISPEFGNILDIRALCQIFQVIVIPDLRDQEVVKKIADWAGMAHPAVVGGLLAAARQSGDETWQHMMQILQPRLAHRWTIANDVGGYWDINLASQPASDSGRGWRIRRRN